MCCSRPTAGACWRARMAGRASASRMRDFRRARWWRMLRTRSILRRCTSGVVNDKEWGGVIRESQRRPELVADECGAGRPGRVQPGPGAGRDDSGGDRAWNLSVGSGAVWERVECRGDACSGSGQCTRRMPFRLRRAGAKGRVAAKPRTGCAEGVSRSMVRCTASRRTGDTMYRGDVAGFAERFGGLPRWTSALSATRDEYRYVAAAKQNSCRRRAWVLWSFRPMTGSTWKTVSAAAPVHAGDGACGGWTGHVVAWRS